MRSLITFLIRRTGNVHQLFHRRNWWSHLNFVPFSFRSQSTRLTHSQSIDRNLRLRISKRMQIGSQWIENRYESTIWCLCTTFRQVWSDGCNRLLANHSSICLNMSTATSFGDSRKNWQKRQMQDTSKPHNNRLAPAFAIPDCSWVWSKWMQAPLQLGKNSLLYWSSVAGTWH